jgi:hypothetical protein
MKPGRQPRGEVGIEQAPEERKKSSQTESDVLGYLKFRRLKRLIHMKDSRFR